MIELTNCALVLEMFFVRDALGDIAEDAIDIFDVAIRIQFNRSDSLNKPHFSIGSSQPQHKIKTILVGDCITDKKLDRFCVGGMVQCNSFAHTDRAFAGFHAMDVIDVLRPPDYARIGFNAPETEGLSLKQQVEQQFRFYT